MAAFEPDSEEQTLDQALSVDIVIQPSAPSIGISLNFEWVPARLHPVGRATPNRIVGRAVRAARALKPTLAAR